MRYSKDEIISEYNSSAEEKNEFEKVKWGSHENMMNRFRVAMRELDFSDGEEWLDVGCGTGAFQKMVTADFPKINATGLDISEKLLAYAGSQQYETDVTFVCGDFLEFDAVEYHVITCIGVLQKTTFDMNDFFMKAYGLLKKGGKLFLDTKNINWMAFNEPNFHPENTHLWFDMKDLRIAAESAGFTILKTAGLLPESGDIVAENMSHSIFMVVEK